MRAFAERHRLRVRRDEAGEPVIPGRDGLIYEYGSGRLAVMVAGTSPEPLTPGPRLRWAYRRRACLAVGMALVQDGDDEGVLTFDPASREQVRVALRVAAVKRRRRVPAPTPAQVAARESFAARARGASIAAESSRSTSDASEAA